jgi:peptide/nickel transport system substrate-binding protein
MKRKLTLLLLSVVFALILAACGSDSEENEEEAEVSAEPETETASEETEAETEEAGDEDAVIRIAMVSEIDSLDPYQSSATDTEIMMANVFDGLFDTDENGELIPNLAEDYSISDDNLTYTFKLVENATFHNGEPFTAEDVVYSYSKLAGLETGEPMSDKWAVVEHVEAISDYEVEVTLEHVDSGFLARTMNAIVPAGYEDQETHPIGAGPFKFVERSVAQELVLERNEDYYMEDSVPEVKEVRFLLMPDPQTSTLAMQSGEIDIIPGINPQGLAQLGDSVETISAPSNMPVIFGLNHAVEPFDNIDVRKAMNMAVDKDEIIDTVFQGRATKLDSNFSPAMAFYYEESVEDYYEVDLDAAKDLLADAGYPDGFDFTLTVPSHATMYTDTAQILADQLSAIGVNVTIDSVEWSTWLEQVYTDFDHEATIIGLTGKVDPYDVLIRFVDGYSRNFINFNNEAYNEAIDHATQEVDDDARAEYYKEAQRILTEEAASVFLMDPDSTTVLREGLSGLKRYPIGKMNLEDITITE